MPTIEHDEHGGTMVLYGDRPSRWYKKQMAKTEVECSRTGICYNLPDLFPGVALSVARKDIVAYRMCVCYAPACCRVVYEPTLILGGKMHDWRWERVSRGRLFWFRLRRWL